MSTRPRGGRGQRRGRGPRNTGMPGHGRPDFNREIMGAGLQVFPTYPLSKFKGEYSLFENITVLGSYSTDEKREFCHDQSNLAFIKQKYIPDDEEMKVNLDLNAFPGKVVKFEKDNRKSLKQLMQWILSSKDEICQQGKPRKLRPNVVCAHHVLSTIAQTPYTSQSPWTLCATKFRGTLFLYTDEDEIYENNYTRWGLVFKHLMQGGMEEVCNPNEEFRLVISAKLGKHRILHAPKIDCVDPDMFVGSFENTEALLLLKTSKELSTEIDQTKFTRFKLLKTWLKCHLCGIPRVLIGFRNDEGVVKKIKKIFAAEMPIIAQDHWTPNVTFNFLEKFLNYVNDIVEDDPNIVYVFERQIRSAVHYSRFQKSDHHAILETWFINEFDED
ncbi:decapping and exoribonuclease protein-like [Oratosquilla oratoria]|uniref:decapping and exoribonuclease protein-like n=1 Tax=Oratosquilla oratoria TaxID=337810 RepID=UPI003F75A977